MVKIIITSVVAGIHRTKVGSHPNIKLVVENDDTVMGIDPCCVCVKIPNLEDLPPQQRRLVTYPKSRNPRDPRQKDQLAYEVAGKKVGNVPMNLCGLFRQLKADGKVKKIECYSTGERPLPSVQPKSKQKFSRPANRRGGGLVLECQYVLELNPGVDNRRILREVEQLLKSMEGDETVSLEEN